MDFERIRDFELALTAAIPEQPQLPEAPLVMRLAEAAREGSVSGRGVGRRGGRAAAARPRFGLALGLAGAIAAILMLFAGLAVAGVTVPEPVRSAFEAVGVELPNQPDGSGDAERAAPSGKRSDQEVGSPAARKEEAAQPDHAANPTQPGMAEEGIKEPARLPASGESPAKAPPGKDNGKAARGPEGKPHASPGQEKKPHASPGQEKKPAAAPKQQKSAEPPGQTKSSGSGPEDPERVKPIGAPPQGEPGLLNPLTGARASLTGDLKEAPDLR